MHCKSNVLLASAFVLLLCGVISCKKDAPLEILPVPVKLQVPGNFPAISDDPDNPLTAEGIELGRMLFYDTRLSGNNRISCASCHRQNLAFSDGLELSNIGISGKKLDRHAPVLFNLVWSKNGLFWDGGSKNLESQAFGPLSSLDEMHQDLFELDAELKAVPDYVRLFNIAFTDGIKSSNVVKALAQFQRTLVSGDSRYDKYVRKESGANLTELELSGLSIVQSKCKGCHSGELFTDDGFHNNGLDAVFSDEKEGIFQGHFRVSFNPKDLGKFKTPSLRNVMLSAPYMHDGRFKTIDQVLDHYQNGIKSSLTTDPLVYQNNNLIGIPINPSERGAIIAFLEALTDETFISNKKFSKPN
jgi:cytochrome c peroxidase